MFPAILTESASVDIKLRHLLHACIESGMGPTAVANAVKEQYTRRYSNCILSYYSICLEYKKFSKVQPTILQSLGGKAKLPPIIFSAFKDIKGYYGRCPTGII